MIKQEFLKFGTLRKILFAACACMFTLSLFAQQSVNVTGTITDQDGEVLSGVSITVKGTTAVTVSNENGNYAISVPGSSSVLVFSFVGFATQEISVGTQTVINVTLVEDVLQLEGTVVIGYGTLEKKQLTSAITSISAKELPQGVGGSTVANALKGKVGNLIVQDDASPNAGLTLQLRGMASVNTSRAPLVVIDGMPGGDIRSVVQEDIQSIDILKDAGAGAIYGTRATGGVILITTKQAQEGKLKLSYTGEAIFKQDFGKPRVLNAQEYMQYKTGVTNYGSNTDWWDAGMADNPTSNRHVLTLQGGAPTAKIYATAMYDDNRGVLMGDNRKDLGGRINGAFKVLDGWLDINVHLDYRQALRNQSSPGVGALLGMNPTKDPNDYPNETLWPKQSGLGETNTIAESKLITNKGLDKWFRPDVELKLNILPIEGLSYHQTLGYENRQWEWQNYQPSNIAVTEGQNRSGKGTAELKFDKTELINADGYFAYVRNFNDHFINASVGYSYFEQNGEMFRLKNYGFAVDAVEVWNIGNGSGLTDPSFGYKAELESSKQVTQRLLAFFGRANYSYKDKYLASATLRHEGSSKFAANRRWGNFWQVSAGWRLSNEVFLKDVSAISDLKLRASYGVTGNEGFSADYAAVMYGASTQVLMPDGTWAPSYKISKNINPDLGWEEKHEWNIGIDYELFNRRVFGKIDFYRRNVEGLIYEVNVPQPPYTESKMFKNIGTLENIGWEFEIGGNIIQSGNWNYTTRMTISHNTTTIGDMSADNDKIKAAYVGRAGDVHQIERNVKVGSFFLYQFAGFDENGDFQAYDKDGGIITPTASGDKTDADKRYIGNYTPSAIIGWSHDLQYKNWSFGMTLTSWVGFDIYNAFEHTSGISGGTAATSFSNSLLDVFTKNAHIKGQALECDYFLENGTFLKIQNLTLGYRFNTKKYLKIMESARLYLTMNNVLTFTGYSGLNPEVNITGWDGGVEWGSVYPQTRTFTIGLQLNF
jgi:TonB-linked SusC/RagA family outer membrane protein